MQIQTLKYLVEIAKTGSINQAARNLYVSQPHLSRTLKDIEQTSNVIIFQRTSKGVELTQEGQKFMAHVYRLLEEYQNLEDTFFNGKQGETVTLKVATQRYSPVISAFLEFYKKCAADTEYVNLAIYEDTMENIVKLVSEQIYNVGVVHILKSNESGFLNMLRAANIHYTLTEDSPIYVQINRNHPLSQMKEIRLKDLQSYPYATFADENVTNINYCCDVQKYNKDVLKKRIIIQDRGTLHSVLSLTDAYHLGTDVSFASRAIPDNLCYIPLVDTKDRILTYWLCMDGVPMTEYEQALFDIYRELQRDHKDKV